MNFKVIFPTAALAATTLFLFAQEEKPAPEGQRPPQPPPEREAGGPGAPRVHVLPRGASETLGLTPDQQKQVSDLETEVQGRLEKILTPDQMQKFQQLRPPQPPNGERGERRRPRENAENGDQGNRRPPADNAAPGERGERRPPRDNGESAPPPRRPGEETTTSDATPPADAKPLPEGVTRVPVTLSGGHETDPVDHGRPVRLIAAALGVPSEVFREAFSHVHPADQNVGPTDAEARKNKAALMGALGKLGVTNDRLNTVSNRYRYVKARGELWTHRPAKVNALMKDGSIIGFEIADGGEGYSSAPQITVAGVSSLNATATLDFGTDFSKNGSVREITLK